MDKIIETTNENKNSNNVISRKYLMRQILICSGIFSINFSYGLTFGSPTVFIPQIRREANSSDAVSTEMASWLSSTVHYSGALNAVVLAILARLIGRKHSFLYVCICSIIGYIIFYCSNNTTHIILSEIFHGPMAASPLTVSTMIITEYSSPRYRGVFLTFKSAIFLWGMWIANTIGTFYHWKNIAILALICSMYSLLTVLLWPESPYWLANKARFEDCARSHRWLRGCSTTSESELEILIESQKSIQCVPRPRNKIIRSIVKMIGSKTFYKPMSISILVVSLYHFSGKIACAMYAIDIIKRVTGTESTAYTGMLILDGITIFSSYVGCGLSKIITRRALLLVPSAIGVAFLFCISLYLYLIHLNVVSESTIISLSLLIGYSLVLSVGPMILCTTIFGELVPLKYRSSSVLFLGFFTNFLAASIMKITPLIINNFGVRGLFLFFAVTESLLIVINTWVLPETKDKTILEIQETLLGTKPKKDTVGYLEDCE